MVVTVPTILLNAHCVYPSLSRVRAYTKYYTIQRNLTKLATLIIKNRAENGFWSYFTSQNEHKIKEEKFIPKLIEFGLLSHRKYCQRQQRRPKDFMLKQTMAENIQSNFRKSSFCYFLELFHKPFQHDSQFTLTSLGTEPKLKVINHCTVFQTIHNNEAL